MSNEKDGSQMVGCSCGQPIPKADVNAVLANRRARNDPRQPQMDWQQVVMNGGPPCFAQLEDEAGRYCGRAERWEGHDGEHKFVSLADLLITVRAEARAETFKEAMETVKSQPSTIGDWMTQSDVAANLRRKIVWALERAAVITEKGESDG